jgi:hypothetical protein
MQNDDSDVLVRAQRFVDVLFHDLRQVSVIGAAKAE